MMIHILLKIKGTEEPAVHFNFTIYLSNKLKLLLMHSLAY